MSYYVYEGGVDHKGRQTFEIDIATCDIETAIERCEEIAKKSQLGGYEEQQGYREILWVDKYDGIILSKLYETV